MQPSFVVPVVSIASKKNFVKAPRLPPCRVSGISTDFSFPAQLPKICSAGNLLSSERMRCLVSKFRSITAAPE